MFCHQCHKDNLDTALNCISCGASLLGKTVSNPNTFSEKFKETDNRIYGRAWATVFTLAYFFVATQLVPDLREDKYIFWGGALLAVALGRFFGRAVARAHNFGL